MAFHQLEKVLARAATNRSFRDELAAGDADLDELGLSDDEQSVLSELVASSGAGLDAVLNVVAALPTNAGTGPGTAAVPSIPSMPAMQAMQNMANAAGQVPAGHPSMPATPGVPTPATTTPAFALMTPTMANSGTVTPGLATATPAASAAMTTAMPAGYPMSAQGIPVGYQMTAAGMQPGYPTQPGATPVGYPTQGAAVPSGYGQMAYQSNQDINGLPAGTPQSGSGPATMGATTQQRALDAGDVGRPVVARLPFGMDVVK